MNRLLLLLSLCISLCLATPQNIIFPTNLAVTLVPGVNGANPTIALLPLNVNDPYQQWDFSNNYITSAAPGFTQYVFDVKQGSNAEHTPIILWPKKTPAARNEQWSLDAATGGVKSNITSTKPMYLAVFNNTLVISSQTPPAAPTFATPITSMSCCSVGDPHICAYYNGRNDLYWAGSQQAGTYTLSKTGKPGDPHYTLIQAEQQLCYPNVQGIYCNQRAIISNHGHIVEIAGNTVTVDGIVVTVTGTYTVGNGISVTKVADSNYIVTYPEGTMQVVKWGGYYTDIYLTTTSGPVPTGGACTKYVGPNTTTRKRDLSAYDFLWSWRVPTMADDLFTYSDELAWRAANPLNFTTSNGHFTTNNATLLAIAQEACGALLNTSTFATQCAAAGVSSNDFYGACLDDVIITGDATFGASNTDAFARRCAEHSNTIALPTSARSSTAAGPGIASSVNGGTLQYFLITARDVNGNVVTTGGDNFVVTATGAGSISFTVTSVGGGNYNVTYTPTVAGAYNISVTLQSADIKNSPFAVTVVGSATTDPSQSTAYGDGLGTNLDSGTTYNVSIQARTSNGTPRTVGGDTVTVTVDGFAFVEDVYDFHNGTYTFAYEQENVGPFEITITINGKPIKGSPFTAETTD